MSVSFCCSTHPAPERARAQTAPLLPSERPEASAVVPSPETATALPNALAATLSTGLSAASSGMPPGVLVTEFEGADAKPVPTLLLALTVKG